MKEGDYVTVTLENVAVLNQLNGKDVTYEGKTIGKISIVSFENVNKHVKGQTQLKMQQARIGINTRDIKNYIYESY